MMDFRAGSETPIEPPERDGVRGLDGTPLIVSISDIHGYLNAARNALTAVGEHEDYEPMVEADDEGRLHWVGGEEYVLVFNGDLIDRGPNNEGVIELVERLSREAPHGHVRTTLGNHEWGLLFPALVQWDEWFSGRATDEDRRRLCRAVANGDVVAAYEGYNFTYAHAGQPSAYQPAYFNGKLIDALTVLEKAIGTDEDAETQRRLVDQYHRILSLGQQNGRGVGAGIVWLDFRYLPAQSPPQIVGHTRHDEPIQKGNVVCENVIRSNRGSLSGDAVLVESPDSLVALSRTFDGDVERTAFSLPDDVDD